MDNVKIVERTQVIVSIFLIMSIIASPLTFIPMQFSWGQNITTTNETNNSNTNPMNTLPTETAVIPDKFIVKLKEPSSLGGAAFSISDPISEVTTDIEGQGFDANVNRSLYGLNTFVLDIKPSENNMFSGASFQDNISSVPSVIENILEENPLVESAQADMLMTIPEPILNTSDVKTSTQTIPRGIDRIDAEAANLSIESTNADIAIMDTGVNNHQDLNLFKNISFVGMSAQDNCGHGTHVAGTAAARNNSVGVVGTAPDARIWNVKVLEQTANGGCSGSLSGILSGIDYVLQNADTIDVVNLSLGGFCPAWEPECESSVYESSINDLINAGVVVVVAAGNDANPADWYVPARFQNVITVSSISDTDGKCGGMGPQSSFGDPDDSLSSFSNHGPIVDIAAPGSDIQSTWNDGTYKQISGTSMASPHVAGQAAQYKATHPDATPSEVYNALLTSATKGNDMCDGNGHGYFTGDIDGTNEPLLYAKNVTTASSPNQNLTRS
jgi:subtilisin family serine protease